MAKVASLDELMLMDLVDPQYYGLKVEGIVMLDHILKEMDFPFPVGVPDMFAVPDGVSLKDADVRAAYRRLTSAYDSSKIIFARSSDPAEKPGVFESHTSLYDPGDFESSFASWIAAAKKVRMSGARALIGQVLAAELEDFAYDSRTEAEYDTDGRFIDWVRIDKTVRSFGGSNTSFVLNSAGIVNRNAPSLIATFGLASKLVRGTDEATLFTYADNLDNQIDAVNLGHNYRVSSYVTYRQASIDLILLDKPDMIISHDYELDTNSSTGITSRYGEFDDLTNVAVDWDLPYIQVKSGDTGIRLTDFVELLCKAAKKISKKLGREIEIEATMNESGVHFLQMREYDLPPINLERLTEIPEERIMLQDKVGSYGFNSFRGDLIISDEMIPVRPDDIFMYVGDDVAGIEPENFKGYQKLVLLSPDLHGRSYVGVHEFGLAIQKLVELRNLGVEAVMLGIKSLREPGFFLSTRPEYVFRDGNYEVIDKNVVALRNVTVECDGRGGQVYRN